MFCPKNGISDSVSPKTTMTGVKLDCKKHCRVETGSAVRTHEVTEPRNDTEKMRTVTAIAMEHGDCKFLNLNTRRVLDRGKWTETPVTDEIVNGVHELADETMCHKQFAFFSQSN